MPEPSAKIVKIDTEQLQPTGACPNDPNCNWKGTSQVSYYVQIEHEGQIYNRKLTFVMHDEKIMHIGAALTEEEVRQAILAEVDQISTIHAVCNTLEAEIDVDQVQALNLKIQKESE